MVSDRMVEVLVQGGAVGVSLVALALIGYIVRVLVNHLTDVTKLLAELSGNVKGLAEVIRGWHDGPA